MNVFNNGDGLKLDAWREELGDDPDRDFILDGVRHGFDIIDPGCTLARVEVPNHPSASPSNPMYHKVSEQVFNEIANGNYVEVDNPPTIVSPLGAIPKPDSGVRLIHDCSRPVGYSVNSYVKVNEKFKFQSVDDAAAMVGPGAFMAKVDLKSAYRSVKISPHSQLATGLKWRVEGKDRYFVDTRLPFGAKLAPSIFHRLSTAVQRIMKRKGFINIVAYLDDFFICYPTFNECAEALRVLISLVRKLGFMVNWNKVVDPCHHITFLGIDIDSRTMQLELSPEKLEGINIEVNKFVKRKRASKRQLQVLIGKLNWCAAVVRGGRVFLRRLIDAIKPLKDQNHKIRFSDNMRADIFWWKHFLLTFNGKTLLLDSRKVAAVYTDACTEGGGGHWGDWWFHVNWCLDSPTFKDCHINVKEVLAVLWAAHHWGHLWSNLKVYIFTDNMTTVASVNKCTSKNPVIMGLLRYLFWLSAVNNFHLRAVHIPGVNNVTADALSRLHDPAIFWSLQNPLCFGGGLVYPSQCLSWSSSRFLLCRHGTDGGGIGCETRSDQG